MKKNITSDIEYHSENNEYFYELKNMLPKTSADLLQKENINDKDIVMFNKNALIEFITYCSYSIINSPITTYYNEIKKIFHTNQSNHISENFYCSIFKICYRACSRILEQKAISKKVRENTLSKLKEWQTHSHDIFLFAGIFYCKALNISEDEYKNTFEQEVISIFKNYLIAALFIRGGNYEKNDIIKYIESLSTIEKTTYEKFYNGLSKIILIQQKKALTLQKKIVKNIVIEAIAPIKENDTVFHLSHKKVNFSE